MKVEGESKDYIFQLLITMDSTPTSQIINKKVGEMFGILPPTLYSKNWKFPITLQIEGPSDLVKAVHQVEKLQTIWKTENTSILYEKNWTNTTLLLHTLHLGKSFFEEMVDDAFMSCIMSNGIGDEDDMDVDELLSIEEVHSRCSSMESTVSLEYRWITGLGEV